MLPTEDAGWVGAELGRRFGLPLWQFTLSATDANRFALRLARHVTGRRSLVFNYCYHGTVDETFVVLGDGAPRPRPGNVGPPVDPPSTTRVVEWNDLAGVERELAHGDVACVLSEPALTNIGIVLPEPGFHDDLRDLCTRGRDAARHRRDAHPLGRPRRLHGGVGARARPPDVGKSIAGGVPVGRLRDDDRAGRAGASPSRRPTTPTSAASAARSPATRCRWPPRGPRSSTS